MSSTTKVSQPKSMMDLQHVVCYAFLFAIMVLLASLVAITVIMIFRPPCTMTGTVCADGWSVAGLAAVILGVGGTMLTVISGLAVAAWWVGLDTKVEKKVEEKVADTIKNLFEEYLKPVKDKLDDHQNILDDISTQLKASNTELDVLRRQLVEPMKNKLDDHQNTLDKYLVELETSDAELNFAHRQLEGILQFVIYHAFPKHMELEAFDLPGLQAFMVTSNASAPLVNANICQTALARFCDAFDRKLERITSEKNGTDHASVGMNLQFKLEEMLSFTIQEEIWSDRSKQYTQKEISKLERINKVTSEQKAKRSSSIRQKIQKIQSE
jgi:hypothetical protein